jgi:DNA repair exonuclease SbcCD ATPase subunit
VASFACRIALWNLGGKGKVNPIFILDESMKHLSEVWRGNASELLKAFCDKLGLQIILSTHLNELMENADNIITVSKRGDTSYAVSEMLEESA